MTDQCPTPDDLVETVHTAIRQAAKKIKRETRAAPDPRRALPVVRVVLNGHLTFDRTRLDMEGLRRIAQDEIEALLVRVENRTSPLKVDTLNPEGMDREELERAILEDLVRSDSRYSGNVTGWAGLMQRVKTSGAGRRRSGRDLRPAGRASARSSRGQSEGTAHVDH